MALGPAAADMTGKSVLITGGTKGLGLGCARVLVAAGANVHICGRDAEAGTRAAAELGVMGPGRCDFISADIGQLDDARELVHKAAARYGRLDCLINNAVLYPGLRAIESIPLELALETIRVNVLAYFVMSREALLYLRETHGTIIMMGQPCRDSRPLARHRLLHDQGRRCVAESVARLGGGTQRGACQLHTPRLRSK